MHKETRALQALTKTNPTTLTGIIRLKIDTERHFQNIENEYKQALEAHNKNSDKIINWVRQNNPTETQWKNEYNRLQELDKNLGHFHT